MSLHRFLMLSTSVRAIRAALYGVLVSSGPRIRKAPAMGKTVTA